MGIFWSLGVCASICRFDLTVVLTTQTEIVNQTASLANVKSNGKLKLRHPIKQTFPLVPDVKLSHNSKSFFARQCQFWINFIKENWSQFGVVQPKIAHKVILVERQIYPDPGFEWLCTVRYFTLFWSSWITSAVNGDFYDRNWKLSIFAIKTILIHMFYTSKERRVSVF